MKSFKPQVIKAESLKLRFKSTGLPSFDRAVGGLVEGSAHLFYGDESSLMKMFNTVAGSTAVNEPVLVVTVRDYHQARSFDTFALAEAVAAFGGDPHYCLQRILVANAYSREQAAALGDLLAKSPPEAGLVAILHLTELYRSSTYPELLRFLSSLKSLLAYGATLAFFVRSSPRSTAPSPDGPVFLRHFCATITRLEKTRRGFVKVVVEKGPLQTPKLLYAKVTDSTLEDVDGWF
ncbi:MAG: hypothetical protein N3E41_00505 [Thermofilaceae archaeon]|nr:hypothetical protein [Thermofilaceae archaeon]